MTNRCFLGGLLLPHPPVIVPSVGQGREQEALPTLNAMNAMADLVSLWQPETVVLISPHAPVFNDFVFFYEPRREETVLKGALRAFGDLHEHAWPWDSELQKLILDALTASGIDAGPLEPAALKRFNIEPELDHGALVPLHFLSKSGVPFQLIVLASAGIDVQQLFALGAIIRESAETLRRRTLLLASGDLSHKVNRHSPYGAVPEGERFDQLLMELFKKSDLSGVAAMDHGLREKAAECGFRSILTLCGALEDLTPNIQVHSYEAPFGIGYGVVSFELPAATRNNTAPSKPEAAASANTEAPVSETTEAPVTATTEAAASATTEAPVPSKVEVSAPVRIARQTIEAFIKKGYRLPVAEADAPEALLETRAGAFVSLHKFGDLRGCIGTIAATTGSLVEEIIQNAISAATGDPRFEPVTASELPHLVINVDVLNPPEPIEDKAALDPKRYGVIVERGMRRGLLLPDLEGVDTVDQQLNIACRKAGIDPEEYFRMERFTVTRYET